MDNKYVLENIYKTHYESAKKYLEQNNILAAKEAFQKALRAEIDLIEGSTGEEKARYKSNAMIIAQMIEKINAKIQEANDKNEKVAPPTKKSSSPKDAPVADAPPEISIEEALEQLNALEGLQVVKEQVKDFIAYKQYTLYQVKYNMPINKKSNHMVFMGNPGTGKTTVARIMAQILHAMGIVSKGQLIEVQRNDLVAGYVGQTAIQTQAVIDKAIGGILFIDEAYTLAKGDGGKDFGQEAIDTILKGMEDHRDDLVVIVAGYEDKMQQFIDSNPGLKSRFPHYLNFTDYTGEELFNIFERMVKKGKYVFTAEAETKTRAFFMEYYKNRGVNFGNARDVRNFFEQTEIKHSKRIVHMGEQKITEALMKTIEVEDLSFVR